MQKKLVVVGLFAFLVGAFAVAQIPRRVAAMEQTEGSQGAMMKLPNAPKKMVKMEKRSEAKHEQETMDRVMDREMPGDKEGVHMTPDGKFRVTGATVNSVSTGDQTINATLFGFSKTVSVNGAKLIGAGHAITLADIAAGDKLAATGTYNAGTHAITLLEIRDVTYKVRITPTNNFQDQINALLKRIEELKAKQAAGGQH